MSVTAVIGIVGAVLAAMVGVIGALTISYLRQIAEGMTEVRTELKLKADKTDVDKLQTITTCGALMAGHEQRIERLNGVTP